MRLEKKNDLLTSIQLEADRVLLSRSGFDAISRCMSCFVLFLRFSLGGERKCQVEPRACSVSPDLATDEKPCHDKPEANRVAFAVSDDSAVV